MGKHNRHPVTRDLIHHWKIHSEIVHLEDNDEGFYLGTCSATKSCKVVKYFSSNPAVNYQSAWRKLKQERESNKKMKVK